MQDLYPNLPGIKVEMKDGNLVIRRDPNPPQTESVLLLGTAVDGPLMQPVAVDPTTVEQVFGRAVDSNGVPNGSTLVKGFEQAYAAGCRDIRLMRITGEYAKGSIKAAAMTFTNDRSFEQVLGPAPGNKEMTFTLNQYEIDVNSVIVTCGSMDLAPGLFTVQNGDAIAGTKATVTIQADVTSAGTPVYITYSYTDPDTGAVVTVREDAYIDDTGKANRYIAAGEDKEYLLTHVPKNGTVRLYANGVEVTGNAFTVNYNTPSITLHPGYTKLGDVLEVSYLYVESVTEEPTMQFESVYAGHLYNEVSIEVKNILNAQNEVIGKEVIIRKPESKKFQLNEAPLTFNSLDYPTFGLMEQAINTHPLNNVVRAKVPNRFKNVATANLQVQPETNLSGGDDGIHVTKQQLYEALGGVRDENGFLVKPGAYQLLENYTVDMVVPLGVYADDELPGKYDNFAYQLALACAVMSHRNSATMGIIATSSPEEVNLQAIAEHVNHLLSLNNDYYMRDRLGNEILDSEQKKIDLGRYISIVAGPDVILSSPRFGVYAENSAAVYAGMISSLPPQSAPTNKAVPGVLGLRFQYSNAQLNELTAKRFVTYRTKANGTIVAVTDAMTAAQPNSDYRRLSTYRIVKEAVNQIREVCDPYIGEPNEVAQRNAMTAAIAKRLDQMKEAGSLVDYSFQVIATPEMQLLGQAMIELTVVPPMELRQITVVVSLRPNA